MEKHSKQILGVILIFAGLALAVLGVKLLFGPNQYAATAKVKLDNEIIELPADGSTNSFSIKYDHYFGTQNLNIIQVLSNTVEELNERSDITTAKPINWTISDVEKNLKISPIRGTKLMAITYTDNNNQATAALVANTILKSYSDCWNRSRYQSLGTNILVLQEKARKFTRQIAIQKANVEELKTRYGFVNDDTTNLPSEISYGYPYDYQDARHLLNVLVDNQKYCESFIKNVPYVSFFPRGFPAELPLIPIGPNRTLGAVEAAVGLFLLCGGVFLLKPAHA